MTMLCSVIIISLISLILIGIRSVGVAAKDIGWES